MKLIYLYTIGIFIMFMSPSSYYVPKELLRIINFSIGRKVITRLMRILY